QAYATFQDLIELTEELLCQLATLVRGGLKLPYQGSQVDFSRPWPRVSMLDIVHKLGVPIGDVEALRAFCSQRAEGSRGELAPPPAGAAWGELIGWAFDNLGERTLDPARPTFVVACPVQISPLPQARSRPPPGRAVRAVHPGARACQCLLGAQRPRRPAGPLRAPAREPRARGC